MLFSLAVAAQENEKINSTEEQQIENMTEANDAEPKDDSYLQQLNHFKKHPLNINAATAEELNELKFYRAYKYRRFYRTENYLAYSSINMNCRPFRPGILLL